jgi:type II secretory pathway component GspD/PulD (secretin)
MRLIGLAVILAVNLTLAPLAAGAQQTIPWGPFSFENADIQTVIKHVGRLTGITFLFDPEQVKGKITLLSPKGVPPTEALELLKSALALHGYSLLSRAAGVWIVPAVQVFHEAMTVKVVPLTYARAGEVAYTLSWVAPPWVRIVPYYPTNSLIISGPPSAVEKLIDIIKPSARD